MLTRVCNFEIVVQKQRVRVKSRFLLNSFSILCSVEKLLLDHSDWLLLYMDQASFFATCCSLVEVLRRHATMHPEKIVYRYLEDGERETATLTYGELDRQARTLAAKLQG